MADQQDSLLREVEEEICRERMAKLWQRYSGLIVAIVVLIPLAVMGYKFFESRRLAAEQAAGADYSAAETLSDNKKKKRPRQLSRRSRMRGRPDTARSRGCNSLLLCSKTARPPTRSRRMMRSRRSQVPIIC